MNDALKPYVTTLAPAILFPIVFLGLAWMFGEPFDPMAAFKIGLVFAMFTLASRGLSTFYPRTKFASLSIPQLIGQFALVGFLFGAAMSLFFDIGKLGAARTDAQFIKSFFFMSLGFGAFNLLFALWERKKLRQQQPIE
jgi:hypothetical protein